VHGYVAVAGTVAVRCDIAVRPGGFAVRQLFATLINSQQNIKLIEKINISIKKNKIERKRDKNAILRTVKNAMHGKGSFAMHGVMPHGKCSFAVHCIMPHGKVLGHGSALAPLPLDFCRAHS
jgi:hypothetical protein